MLRFIRRFLLITLAAVAGLLLLLSAVAYFFQDEVKSRLVAVLNTHLTAPLHQKAIELTLIKRFPQASLRIKGAYMQEVRSDGQAPDTLLYAEDLYLEFSILSLLTGNQVIRELHGTGVTLRPGFDTRGKENWLVWKSDTSASPSTGGTNINLKRVTFDGLAARFRDDRSSLEVAFTSEKLALGGQFRDQGSRLTAKGDIWLDRWKDAQGTHLSDRRTVLDASMRFGGQGRPFEVEKGELLLGKSPVSFTLAVLEKEDGDHLELRANGFNVELATVVQMMPDGLRRSLRRYGMAGRADLALHYSGPMHAPGPALSLGMELRDGRFTELASGTVFKKVNGQFSIDFTPDWVPAKLLVKNFMANSSSGPIGGHLELTGTRNAKVLADVHADLALADLLRFIGLDTLEQVGGRLNATAHVQGKLRNVEDLRASDLQALAITGSVKLNDASLKLKGLRHRITALNAEMALAGNDAKVHGLRFNLQGNPMELTGTLRNLMPYAFFKDQRLTIEAKGSSPLIDLASLLEAGGERSGSPSAYAFTLPPLIDLDLRAEVGELRMEKFNAKAITGQLKISGQQLALEQLSFRTADGTVRGSLKLDARPAPAYPLSITAELKGIDVNKLFAEFQDFGQSFITSRHVKGRGDAQLAFNAPLRPDFSLDQDRLRCVADISLVNGELNEHASLIEVADYLQRNKLTAAFVDAGALRKQFRNVRFAKLENRIEIKDRMVHLPLMTVSSSVMDMEVSGTHGFDGTVDDHLNFRLGDLFRSGRSNEDEFGPIIDDGTGLRVFLHMYGTTDQLQFGHDGAMAAARRKERMRQETAQLKGILKGMVGGEGATRPETPKAHGQDRITVQFGEEGTTQAQPAPKPKKGLGRLLQKDEKTSPTPVITVE